MWQKSSLGKSVSQGVEVVKDHEKLLKNARKEFGRLCNVDPVEVTRRSLFMADNISTFTEAASYQIYKRTQETLGLSANKVKTRPTSGM